MIAPLFGMLYATNLSHDAANAMFGAAEARMSLANSATPASDPTALARMDKALQLQGIQAQTNYQVSQAMLESSRRMLRQHEETRRKLMEAGATLV
ncbi:MAG TPA: hypothetical protein V6C99_00460 [Oculatellaceae cyanobacterium]|jgi:hypothetical protein